MVVQKKTLVYRNLSARCFAASLHIKKKNFVITVWLKKFTYNVEAVLKKLRKKYIILWILKNNMSVNIVKNNRKKKNSR